MLYTLLNALCCCYAPNLKKSVVIINPYSQHSLSFNMKFPVTVFQACRGMYQVGRRRLQRLLSAVLLLRVSNVYPSRHCLIALIVYAHPYCARNSCRNATPRHASSARDEETFQPHIRVSSRCDNFACSLLA